MQYIPTDLPQYWKLHNRSQFSNAIIESDAVLLFSQDGKTILAKTHQGTVVPAGGAASDSSLLALEAGYIDENGNFQPLSFNGTQASSSGSAIEGLTKSIFNTGVAEPQYGGSVTPSPSPGTSMDFYKCTYVNSDSWGGRKAVLNNGAYSFQSDSTGSLTYSVTIPEVGKIYDNGALVVVSLLWSGIPQPGLIRYAPMRASAAADALGNTLTTRGTPTFAVDSGIPCAAMDSGSFIGYYNSFYGPNSYTLSIWMKKTSSEEQAFMTFSGGNYGYGGNEIWVFLRADDRISITNGAAENPNIIVTDDTFSGWHHIAVVWTGSVFRLYVDGVQQGSDTSTEYYSGEYGFYPYINSLQRAREEVRGNGKYAAFRLYDRVLSAAEISALAAQFTPTA